MSPLVFSFHKTKDAALRHASLVKFERWAERQRTALFSSRSFTSAVSHRSIAGEGNG
jgi:hypothetical protein